MDSSLQSGSRCAPECVCVRARASMCACLLSVRVREYVCVCVTVCVCARARCLLWALQNMSLCVRDASLTFSLLVFQYEQSPITPGEKRKSMVNINDDLLGSLSEQVCNTRAL